MKNRLLYILTLFLFLPSFISAQEVPPLGGGGGEPIGSVDILPIGLWEENDSLYILMDIRMISKTMNDCQSWQIVPELVDPEGNHKIALPYILINGKKKEQLYKRRLRFKDLSLLQNPPHLKEVSDKLYGNTVTYAYALPYKSWMDQAALQIRQILTSCADQEQWFLLKNFGEVQRETYIPYQPAVRVNYIEPERTVKLRQMQGEAFLDFAAGKTEIVPTYRRNPTELQKISQSIQVVVNDSDVELTELRIEGYASPDGTYALNERLSQGRAMALKSYLQRNHSLSETYFTVGSIAEDWDGLRKLIENSPLIDKEQILRIINSDDDPDRKEQQLRSLSSWRTLLNDYFPQLRRVKYKIDYRVRDFTIEEAETLLLKEPGHLNPSELFTVAENFGVDSPRWHEIMQLTLLLYPDDPVAHINMAASALSQGQLEAAYKYLEPVKDDPRAFNNLGAYYLLVADPEQADLYLHQAIEPESISHNLEELEKVREDLAKQQRRAMRGIDETD